MGTTYTAAWVPDDDPGRPWETSAALGVAWTEEQCAATGARGVLVTNVVDAVDYAPSLRRFADRHQHTTPRARSRGRATPGPVLVYAPDWAALEHAASLAGGHSLCVVESFATPLLGWAMETRAVDLTHPQDAPEPLDGALADALDRLSPYVDKGFGTSYDRKQAARVLDDLRGAGLLDAEVVLAAMAARGLPPDGIRRLGRLIDAGA